MAVRAFPRVARRARTMLWVRYRASFPQLGPSFFSMTPFIEELGCPGGGLMIPELLEVFLQTS